MAFQPTAFQLNAFQMAASNVNRSGVVRLWLAQLTAELNGMVEKEEPKPVVEPTPVILEQIKENEDGSVTVGVENKPKRVKKAKKPIVLKPFKKPLKPVDPSEYTKRDLPSPQETADFLYARLADLAFDQVWAEEKVLEALRQAAEEHEEEEMLIEAAVQFMF